MISLVIVSSVISEVIVCWFENLTTRHSQSVKLLIKDPTKLLSIPTHTLGTNMCLGLIVCHCLNWQNFGHFPNWDFHFLVFTTRNLNGARIRGFAPLVLSQVGGIYLNRAARASPNRVALILQIDYHPPRAGGHISNGRLGRTYSLEIRIDYLSSSVEQVR